MLEAKAKTNMKYLILIHLAYLAIISCDDLCDPEYPDSCGDDETGKFIKTIVFYSIITFLKRTLAHSRPRRLQSSFSGEKLQGGIHSG